MKQHFEQVTVADMIRVLSHLPTDATVFFSDNCDVYLHVASDGSVVRFDPDPLIQQYQETEHPEYMDINQPVMF